MAKSSPRPRSGHQQRRIDAERAAKRRRLLTLAGAVVVALIAAVGLISLNSRGESGPSTVVAATTRIDASIPRDGRVLGSASAPVEIDVWGDYQCPHCKSFDETILPQIVQDYVAPGTVRVVYRDMPFLDRAIRVNGAGTPAAGDGESVRAAEAAACAADQGKFWEFHAALFANQKGENIGSFTMDRLQKIAGLVSLDSAQFQTCLTDGTHRDEVVASYLQAQQLGVNATPTVMINGKPVEFANYGDLKEQIDAAIAG